MRRRGGFAAGALDDGRGRERRVAREMEEKSQARTSDVEAGARGKRPELSADLWSILLVGAALAAPLTPCAARDAPHP